MIDPAGVPPGPSGGDLRRTIPARASNDRVERGPERSGRPWDLTVPYDMVVSRATRPGIFPSPEERSMAVSLSESAAKEVKKIIADQKPSGGHRPPGRRPGRRLQRLRLQPELRHGRHREGPGRRVLRRQAGRREEVRPVPRRHRRRLLRWAREAWLRLQQPERRQVVRLRQLVPGLIARAIPDTTDGGGPCGPPPFAFEADRTWWVRPGRAGSPGGSSCSWRRPPSRSAARPGPAGHGIRPPWGAPG